MALSLLAALAILVAVVATGERDTRASDSGEPARGLVAQPAPKHALLEVELSGATSDVPAEPRSGFVSRTVLEASVAPSTAGVALVAPADGSLLGRWTDPQGEPIREQRFHLIPVDPARQPAYAQRAKGYFARGRTSGAPTTDLEGRFRIDGLAPGEYLVTEGAKHDWRTIAGPLATGSEARVVSALYRIEVTVEDETGLARTQGDGWSLAHLFCTPMLDEVGSASPWLVHESVAGHLLSDGTVVFLVEPERTYRVGYAALDVPTRICEVPVPRERCATRVELRLAAPVEPGTLELTLLTPTEEPLDPLTWRSVAIREADSGRPVAFGRDGAWQGDGYGALFRSDLTPGSYDVRVKAGFEEWGTAGAPRFTPAGQRVEVWSGRRTQAELVLGGSGTLELTVALPSPDPRLLELEGAFPAPGSAALEDFAGALEDAR
jgi:hypothetical protein